jgi:hypothetical protein
MHECAPNWKVWLSASLFPLKLYTALAVLWLVIWHSLLPANQSSALTGIFDAGWHARVSDFCAAAQYVRLGYLLIAFVLVVGSLVQWFKQSHKAASWSFVFGAGALVAAIWLRGYCQQPGGQVF